MTKPRLFERRFNLPDVPAVLKYLSTPDPNTGCWNWTVYKNPRGYGILWRLGETLAHRVSYRVFVGPIPKGLFVCHSCDNPACINPKHLFCATHAENMRDAKIKGRYKHGENHYAHKLTARDVLEIRKAEGSATAIGARFGVTRRAVSMIKARQRWASL